MRYTAVFFFPNRRDHHGRTGIYKFRKDIDLDTVKELMKYTEAAEESVYMYTVRYAATESIYKTIDKKHVKNLWAQSELYKRGY